MNYPEDLKPARFKGLDIEYVGNRGGYQFKGIPLDHPIYMKIYANGIHMKTELAKFSHVDEDGHLVFEVMEYGGMSQHTIAPDCFPIHEWKTSKNMTLKTEFTDDGLYTKQKRI